MYVCMLWPESPKCGIANTATERNRLNSSFVEDVVNIPHLTRSKAASEGLGPLNGKNIGYALSDLSCL